MDEFNFLLEFLADYLDGRYYCLDGVSGRFRKEKYEVVYPSRREVLKIYHQADPDGRASQHYLELKAKLRDDWDTDLTDSERLCEIAFNLSPGA